MALKGKDKYIYSELHKEFFTHITKFLNDFLEMSDIRDLGQFLVQEENKLFNRRITTFVKVSEQPKLQDLLNHVLITEPLSSELHSTYFIKRREITACYISKETKQPEIKKIKKNH